MFPNPLIELNSFSLKELISDLRVEEIINFKDWQINDISNNSQQVSSESIFVAIKGYTTDGHQYINEALNNGVRVIIGEKKLDLLEDVTYIRVKNSRKALAELTNLLYDNPSYRLRLIGVTGTVGKTTTTGIIDHIINQIVDNSGLIGTLYTKINDRYYQNPKKCTTPDIINLNRIFGEMEEDGIDYVTMEVSSHALKLDRVWGLDYDIAIFTNMSCDHLDFHQTLDDYYQSKAKLFSNLAEDKLAVLNLDDKNSKLIKDVTTSQLYTYGIDNSDADIIAKNIKSSKQGLEFEIQIQHEIISNLGQIIHPTTVKVNLALLGNHNIYNSLAAFTATILLGFSISKVVTALESFAGIKRRMQLIYDDQFTIVDDFAHNQASLTANFNTLKEWDYNRLIILHFLKGKRGITANRCNAQIIKNWANKLKLKKVITTRAEEEVIEKNRVLDNEEISFTKIIEDDKIDITNTTKLSTAIEVALDELNTGDLLLLLGGPGLDRAATLLKKRV